MNAGSAQKRGGGEIREQRLALRMALALIEGYSTVVDELEVGCFDADLERLRDRLQGDCGGSAW